MVFDQGERLDRWAGLLQHLRKSARDIYVYGNNHYAEYAPATMEGLAAKVAAIVGRDVGPG